MLSLLSMPHSVDYLLKMNINIEYVSAISRTSILLDVDLIKCMYSILKLQERNRPETAVDSAAVCPKTLLSALVSI